MNPAQTPERFLEVTQLVDATSLMVLGGLHPEETDLVPTGCKTLIFLAPKINISGLFLPKARKRQMVHQTRLTGGLKGLCPI